jgi:hypothetical protein
MERTEGVSTPPLTSKVCNKTRKPRRHRQAALRRVLAMLTTIGRNYAPDFDGVHLQGVQSDSLESFKVLTELQVGETTVLCASFVRAAFAIILYVF